MSNLPPPMLGFDLFHRSMRAGARRLARALSRPEEAAPTERIAPWFDAYRRACLQHAHGEDAVLWPALAGARSDLADVFETMDAEHVELAGLLEDIAASLQAPEARAESRTLAERLVELIDRHLDGEEATAVPALVEALHDQLGPLMGQVQQSSGPEGAPTAIPFLLEHATADERAAVLDMVPPPVREGAETSWEPAYRALVEAAEGSSA